MSDGLTPGTPDLISLLLDSDTLDDFLQVLAESALLKAPAADGCGITLERENRPLTVVSASLAVATVLADAEKLSVLLLGGRVRGATLATVDHGAS
nr:hypothetical protein [Streptomyces sp. DSM 41633]